MDGWVSGWVGGWVSGRVDGWAGGWMDGWAGGWMDGRVDGWMGGWMDGVSEIVSTLGLKAVFWHPETCSSTICEDMRYLRM